MGMMLRKYYKKTEPKQIPKEEKVKLEEQTVKQLKKMADNRNLKYDSSIKKPELIKLLK